MAEPFNPFTAEFRANPYRAYAAYRPLGSVQWGVSPNPKLPGAWYVFGHAEVMQALHDHRLGREAHKVLPAEVMPAMPMGCEPFAALFRKYCSNACRTCSLQRKN